MRTSRPPAPSRLRLAGAEERASLPRTTPPSTAPCHSSSSGLMAKSSGFRTRSPARHDDPWPPPERLRLAGRSEAREHVGRRRHLRGASGEAGDDLGEHARVRRDDREPLVRSRRRLVGEPREPRRPRAAPRSRRRRAGRRSPGRAGRAPRRRRATAAARPPAPPRPRARRPTAAENSAPVFSRCSAARSSVSPVTSRYCPPIIPSVDWASSRPTIGVG